MSSSSAIKAVQTLLSSVLPNIPGGYLLGRASGSSAGAVQLIPISGLVSSATTKASQTSSSAADDALATAEAYTDTKTAAAIVTAEAYTDTKVGAIGVLFMTAASALSGNMAVCADASGNAVYPAISSVTDGGRLVGITTGAVASGATASIQCSGPMTYASWSWTPGPVYCADGGVLTQSAPTSAWVRQVATAVSATTIVIGLGLLVATG